MYSLDEMSTWAPEEVLERIKLNLPKGWRVDYVFDNEERRFRCSFHDAEDKEKWSDQGVDPKILFLDALGWLMLRDKKPQHPAWQRRRGEIDPSQLGDRTTPKGSSPSQRVGVDPEDVDPEEVAAVYSKHNQED